MEPEAGAEGAAEEEGPEVEVELAPPAPPEAEAGVGRAEGEVEGVAEEEEALDRECGLSRAALGRRRGVVGVMAQVWLCC